MGSQKAEKAKTQNFDEMVKSHFSGWMPACAGMTEIISILYLFIYCHSRAGGNPEG